MKAALIDIAVIWGHCLAKARSISILTVRLWVCLAAVLPGRKWNRAGTLQHFFCLFTTVFQCPLFDLRAWRWQISRETGTAAQLYWNRLTQYSSEALTSLTALQIALQLQEVLPPPACSGNAATLTKNLITNCTKKKRHRTCLFYNYWDTWECASRPQLRQACENM